MTDAQNTTNNQMATATTWSSVEYYRRKTEEARKDPRSSTELLDLALAEENEDKSWDLIVQLHWRGTRDAFDSAKSFIESSDVNKQLLGIQVLGQLGIPTRTFPDESLRILVNLLLPEQDALVLGEVGIALGHLYDPGAIQPLTKFKNHPNADVRYGVVHGLLGHVEPLALRTLIELSSDEDPNVRDWATFGIGQQIDMEDLEDAEEVALYDAPEIRDALYARVSDEHDPTRGEALVGLAVRKDARVLEPLIRELSSDNEFMFALDAATALADARLCPVLLSLEKQWEDDEEDAHSRELKLALESCNCFQVPRATMNDNT